MYLLPLGQHDPTFLLACFLWWTGLCSQLPQREELVLWNTAGPGYIPASVLMVSSKSFHLFIPV